MTARAGEVRYNYRDREALVSKVVRLFLMAWQYRGCVTDAFETVEPTFFREGEVRDALSYYAGRQVWKCPVELLGSNRPVTGPRTVELNG